MNFNILIAVFSSFLLVNGACAANKTGVTDSLNAGASRIDLDYTYLGATSNGRSTSTTSTLDYSAKSTASRLGATYLFGVTDRLSMGVLLGFSKSVGETSYVIAPNSYVFTSKYEGATNPAINAQYLLFDKTNNQIALLIFGSFSPASAASDAAVSQVETNGVVTTAGVTGKSGNGFSTSSIGATVSKPVAMGDVFARFDYSVYGEQSIGGSVSKSGALTAMQFGLESKVGDSATVRPYVRVLSSGGGYSGTTQFATNVSYSLGLEGIKDVSKSVSFGVTGEYGLLSNSESSSPGVRSSASSQYYLLNLRGMFFF